jgi:two-component system phosphate regulon sensor histidine kinase PhoR
MKIIHGTAFGSASPASSAPIAAASPAAAASAPRDLIADTSHELRTPLSVLGGLIETLSELDLDAERSRQYLDLMAQQCKRMRAIVDGLLELSTLEGKSDAGPGERIDIAALLARIRAEAEVLSGHRLTVTLDAQTGFDLLGHERDITSAIGNLVTNAVRYTPPGGEIRITWRASARGGECAVQDTGVGIDEKHLPLLTERFYRVQQGVHAAGRRGAGGAGLGLAIVKAALARHQATLEIRSEAGKGSCFTARFPAQRMIASQTAPSSFEGIAA